LVPMAVVALGVILNTAVCYYAAQPIPKLGIAMSPWISPLTALGATWIGFPLATSLLAGGNPQGDVFREIYAPVAFVIGISGPLLGADLLHWNDFKKISAGTVSIGGAGTWDGIVLSGLLAALLA